MPVGCMYSFLYVQGFKQLLILILSFISAEMGCSEEILTIIAMLQVQDVFLSPPGEKQKAVSLSQAILRSKFLFSFVSGTSKIQFFH